MAGNLPLEAAVRIARMKLDDMLSYDLKSAVKEVVGTCVSVGVTVEGMKPREMIQAINDGKYNSISSNRCQTTIEDREVVYYGGKGWLTEPLYRKP